MSSSFGRSWRLDAVTAVMATVFACAAQAHDVSAVQRRILTTGGHLDYLQAGAVHMLTGYDHLLFLFGVMFFLTRLSDIVKFVTVSRSATASPCSAPLCSA